MPLREALEEMFLLIVIALAGGHPPSMTADAGGQEGEPHPRRGQGAVLHRFNCGLVLTVKQFQPSS